MQSILERQKQQNGFLALSDRLRLRSAQSRSNDLSTAVSVDPLVHSNTKDLRLMGLEQKEKKQPDDDGAQTPTRTSCNRRGHQSSNVKGAKDRLKEVRARLRECNKKKNQKA
ncbi:hypothetical protein LB505_000886 [Fusarium chuoi]|nr:hypothetical protein LB505_000886 [Fusarium chuoi]